MQPTEFRQPAGKGQGGSVVNNSDDPPALLPSKPWVSFGKLPAPPPQQQPPIAQPPKPEAAFGKNRMTPLDPNTGLMGPEGDAKRELLRLMTPEDRATALSQMDPKERSLLLGGSAVRADVHTTGAAFSPDFTDMRPPHSRGYDPKTEWQMSVIAKRVYEPFPSEGSTEVTPAVADLVKAGFKIEYLGTEKTSTQGFVAIRGQEVIVAFRGTEPSKTNDLLADANVIPALGYGGFLGAAHGGFDHAFKEVWPRLEQVLTKAQADLPEGEKLSINITGHSLGAAIATVAAWHIDDKKLGDVDGLHTFGSPRVFNFQAAAAFEERLGDRTYRHENNSDIVAKMPNLGWKHVGEHIFNDHFGNLVVKPDASVVFAEAHRAGEEDRAHGLTQAHGGEPEILWDHGIDGYVKTGYMNMNSPVDLQAKGS